MFERPSQVSAFSCVLLLVVLLYSMVVGSSTAHAATATCLDVECLLDTQAPTGSVTINGGAVYTKSATVSVAVPGRDSGSGVSHVRLSSRPTTSGKLLKYGKTYAYTTPISWSLSDGAYGGSTSEGKRAVYAQWRDRAGNWSVIKSDTIVLDFGLEEGRFLKLINDYRSSKGLPALRRSSTLTTASRWMSADMGRNRYFGHVDSKGRDPFQRMAAFGYNYNTYKGENLAAGHASAQSVLRAWLDSPSHLKQINNPNYRAIGIGRVYIDGSPYGWYWTTDFGGYWDG